ncbi:PepSY-associated TM helix domain-containing protein [Polaribacter sp.]
MDIFGIAMLIIAITGMFISKGKYSFKKREWILTLIGLIFPFIFLFLIQ